MTLGVPAESANGSRCTGCGGGMATWIPGVLVRFIFYVHWGIIGPRLLVSPHLGSVLTRCWQVLSTQPGFSFMSRVFEFEHTGHERKPYHHQWHSAGFSFMSRVLEFEHTVHERKSHNVPLVVVSQITMNETMMNT